PRKFPQHRLKHAPWLCTAQAVSALPGPSISSTSAGSPKASTHYAVVSMLGWIGNKQKSRGTIFVYDASRFINLAETEGFEPSVSFPTLVFKTSAFGRSATSPCALRDSHIYSGLNSSTQKDYLIEG